MFSTHICVPLSAADARVCARMDEQLYDTPQCLQNAFTNWPDVDNKVIKCLGVGTHGGRRSKNATAIQLCWDNGEYIQRTTRN